VAWKFPQERAPKLLEMGEVEIPKKEALSVRVINPKRLLGDLTHGGVGGTVEVYPCEGQRNKEMFCLSVSARRDLVTDFK
jgi:hypothetical protein